MANEPRSIMSERFETVPDPQHNLMVIIDNKYGAGSAGFDSSHRWPLFSLFTKYGFVIQVSAAWPGG